MAATEAAEARELFTAVREGVRAAGGEAGDGEDGLAIADQRDPLGEAWGQKNRERKRT